MAEFASINHFSNYRTLCMSLPLSNSFAVKTPHSGIASVISWPISICPCFTPSMLRLSTDHADLLYPKARLAIVKRQA